MYRTFNSWSCWAVVLGLAFHASAQSPDFARDVRPILSQHCFKCHGPDEKSRQGGLRLDDRASALEGGDSQTPAIVPGKAAESELIRRITSADPDSVMPPPSTKRHLEPAQIEILRRWVDSQATYTQHWAFQTPVPPALPSPTEQPIAFNGANQGVNHGAPANPIDVLVAHSAAAAGLTLAPPADSATWLRRVWLDLVGLPPEYEEVQRFVRDSRPDARSRVIDRLLASPAMGERWGRRWLDLARYADTNGYEKDRPRSIWPYRDWVISAINSDMPLSDFAIKQLAGDLLPNASQSDLVATGFHRNTMINEEGGIDPLEYRYYAMVDRVNTTSTAWLGLTMGCAQCHDHKYDPITQQDYYALMALLNNAEEPDLEVIDPEIALKQQQVDSQVSALMAQRADEFPLPSEATQWIPAGVLSVSGLAETSDSPNSSDSAGLTWSKADNQRWQSSGKPPAKDITTIELSAQSSFTPGGSLVAIRLRAVGDAQSKKSLGWSKTDNFVITRARLRSVQADDSTLKLGKLAFSSASASFEQASYEAGGTLDDDDKSGWGVAGHAGMPCEITWYLSQPVPWPSKGSLALVLEQQLGGSHLLRGFELSLGLASPAPNGLAQLRREHLRQAYQKWLQTTRPSVAQWRLLKPDRVQANMARLEPQSDGSFLAIGDISKRDEYLFDLSDLPAETTAIMIEGLPDASLPRRGPGRTYYEGPIGDFFLSEVNLLGQSSTAIKIREAWVDFALAGREAAKSLDGDPLTGWSIDGQQGQAHRMVVALDKPLTDASAVTLRLLFERYYASPIGRVRLWATDSKQVGQATATLSPELQNTIHQSAVRSELAADSGPVWEHYLSQAPELGPVNARIEALRKSRPKFATTMIMRPRPSGFVRETHRYHRGEFLNPRETVQPAVPEFLRPVSRQLPKDRLQLANWLFEPNHPLVSRVIANRYWANVMGRGLVSTEEDFGFQGGFPSNQPLLDWLAKELVSEHL
ncbi:MAG: DUF1549 domain-containing protein, partial [Pirellulaceae bacterium]|nr:DUF1549 domain-containing protein [Pirellulaceae bacterium]